MERLSGFSLGLCHANFWDSHCSDPPCTDAMVEGAQAAASQQHRSTQQRSPIFLVLRPHPLQHLVHRERRSVARGICGTSACSTAVAPNPMPSDMNAGMAIPTSGQLQVL